LWVAILCDAFPGRFLSEILSEIDRLTVGVLEEVLEARSYRQAKGMTDAADSPEARRRLPQTPLFALVTEIEFALIQEERETADDDPAAQV